jgi:Protein of unknown function (DUF4058)
MPSVFPGMDPYLENPELWSAVHVRLIVAIADELVDHLSEKYRVEIEKRTYWSLDESNVLVGIPDVMIATSRRFDRTPVVSTGAVAVVEPESVIVPVSEEVNERYLEIREVATGRVVTVIELLSPKNKRTGEGRTAYENKRNRILASLTNFVEIDLLRGGNPFPIAATNLGDYRILICRSDQRPRGDLYAFKIRQPIPSVPIPLMANEIAPILDLQKLLNQVYDRGRYYLAIDYTQSLTPALSMQDRQWLDQQSQAAS